MVETVSVSAGIAARYAQAAFELADEAEGLDRLASEASDLRAALEESADFRSLIRSPIHSREEMANAVAAIAARMGLGPVLANTLSLMAAKRRLFALPAMLARVDELISARKGVTRAQIVSAQELDADELARISELLRNSAGTDVEIEVSVDESLIGGLMAKLGSRMVDGTLRTRLSNLGNAMRMAG